ncbi:PDZ domain-containing protein [Candidatus Obscuribacterales bacterium]|nr:PDZ domain-containing protein [Candidatus Obscuribacterales bacterium]MBX3154353.1 PDZ domain-containing protein [Candidatus Obscuribacterales bacterium]
MLRMNAILLIALASLLLMFAAPSYGLDGRNSEPDPLGTTGLRSHTTIEFHRSPQELYDNAWKTIKEVYYDQSFHGQDWNRWKRRYDGKLETPSDAFEAIDTMLASLAPPCYSTFWISGMRLCSYDWDYSPKGIGVIHRATKAGIVVESVFANSPAAGESKLLPEDIITEVDGIDAKGKSSIDASRMLQGRPDTMVSLTVLRRGEKRKVDCSRSWNEYNFAAATGMTKGRIAYINAACLGLHPVDELTGELKRFRNCRGLILDLRCCDSFLLWHDEAQKLADAFLTSGVIARYRDKDGVHQIDASRGARFRMPLVVLVSKENYGNVELLLAALQQTRRAILVGEKTKGMLRPYTYVYKLTSQRIFHTKGREYLTPSGEIFKGEITPDEIVSVSMGEIEEGKGCWWLNQKHFEEYLSSPKDKQLNAAINILEAQFSKKS